jgi:hypothetical protein
MHQVLTPPTSSPGVGLLKGIEVSAQAAQRVYAPCDNAPSDSGSVTVSIWRIGEEALNRLMMQVDGKSTKAPPEEGQPRAAQRACLPSR